MDILDKAIPTKVFFPKGYNSDITTAKAEMVKALGLPEDWHEFLIFREDYKTITLKEKMSYNYKNNIFRRWKRGIEATITENLKINVNQYIVDRKIAALKQIDTINQMSELEVLVEDTLKEFRTPEIQVKFDTNYGGNIRIELVTGPFSIDVQAVLRLKRKGGTKETDMEFPNLYVGSTPNLERLRLASKTAEEYYEKLNPVITGLVRKLPRAFWDLPEIV